VRIVRWTAALPVLGAAAANNEISPSDRRRLRRPWLTSCARSGEFLFANELPFAYGFGLQDLTCSLEIRLLDIHITRTRNTPASPTTNAALLQHGADTYLWLAPTRVRFGLSAGVLFALTASARLRTMASRDYRDTHDEQPSPHGKSGDRISKDQPNKRNAK
jgi:hypothetical protein